MNRPLPQLNGDIFLTDGGIETDLIFNEGIELPCFASIVLVGNPTGEAALTRYYRKFIDLADDANVGFILESPTWRANRDWADQVGLSKAALAQANARAISLLHEIRDAQSEKNRLVISGCIGPRGDGYVAGKRMTVEAARTYHDFQARIFAESGADMISAITMTYHEEAMGITLAARDRGLPVAISFTTETDGRLPGGETLAEAIRLVDEATDEGPAYYMINCAHPDHFADALEEGAAWTRRIRGVRANASRLSHAELDAAEALDVGDPDEFGRLYASLRQRFPALTVLGGCCGTDHRHIDAVRQACC